MRSLTVNASSFLVATIVVMALSLGLLQIGAFGDQPESIVLNPTITPAVLEATETPLPEPVP